jgi:hypothetical protein
MSEADKIRALEGPDHPRFEDLNLRFTEDDFLAMKEARSRGVYWRQIGEVYFPEGGRPDLKAQRAHSMYKRLKARFES